MIIEICIDSYEGALLAQAHGVKRVELCSALSVGGMTPSISLTKACTSLKGIEVHAMVRHREGNFVYTPKDIQLMKSDLHLLAEAGVHGVVFGCLTAQQEIDLRATQELTLIAKSLGLEVTFHRAFDFVANTAQALEQLIKLGIDRLLSSGKAPTAIEGIEILQSLVKQAQCRIQIMAGSGVNAGNALSLAKIGVDALHFTSHQWLENSNEFGMGHRSVPDPQKIDSIVRLFS